VFYYILTATLQIIQVVSIFDSVLLPLLPIGTLPTTEPLIAGFFEFVQGVIRLSDSQIPLHLKLALTAFCVSFAGLSVHTQTFMFATGISVSYFKYFMLRVLHGVVSFILILVFFEPFTHHLKPTFLPENSYVPNPYQPFIQVTLLIIGMYYVTKAAHYFFTKRRKPVKRFN
ncbi:MAG: hypothetical protein ACRCST_07935, partial [Turicibacter sp.]